MVNAGAPSTLWPGPVAVVSPHFDDAVLSCGRLLAASPASHVVTVFSAGPRRAWRLTAWDRTSEIFSPGADVMGARRAEDDAALSLLGAQGHRLGMWDPQYRRPLELPRRWRRQAGDDSRRLVEAVTARLESVIGTLEVGTWLAPLGLVHADHAATAGACRAAAARHPELRWGLYEELPYRCEHPELVPDALARWQAAGFETPVVEDDPGDAPERKRAAVEAYRSQCRALGDRLPAVLEAAERYHRLVPAGQPVP